MAYWKEESEEIVKKQIRVYSLPGLQSTGAKKKDQTFFSHGTFYFLFKEYEYTTPKIARKQTETTYCFLRKSIGCDIY